MKSGKEEDGEKGGGGGVRNACEEEWEEEEEEVEEEEEEEKRRREKDLEEGIKQDHIPVDGTSTSRMNMKMTVIPPIKTNGSLNPPTWRRQMRSII